MTMPADNWAVLLAPVARELLGEPNRRVTRGADWRYGTRGSLSVQTDRGVWFDHEEGRGGGLIDLVVRELDCDKRAAIEWLYDRGFLRHNEARVPRSLRRSIGQPVRTPSPARSPASRAGQFRSDSVRIVESLWLASTPADGTPGRTYLVDRGVWPPPGFTDDAALPRDVRWVARQSAPARDRGAKWTGVPPGLAGAVLFGLRCPGAKDLRAVALEGLDARGRRPRERWRRVYGRAKGAVFEAQTSASGETVHLVEGFVDALALMWAPWLEPRNGRILAMGGTSGLKSLRARDVPTLFRSASVVIIHADGDGAGVDAAVQAQAHIQAAGKTCRIRRCAPGLDPADEVARWVRQCAAVSETNGCLDGTAAASRG